MWRVRPRLAVCGHIHDGRGAERVTWGPDDGAGASTRTAWVDPGAGNNKLSLVDLTGRHSPALANDGSVRRGGPAALTHATTRPPSDARPPAVLDSGASSERSSIIDNNTEPPGQKARPPRRDGEARAGTTGRRETCVVNAAIMKSRHPHVGGKQLRKPIVVDLDLPVWEEAPGRES
ncbi:hypothetical protein CDD83_9754 [Cordyceps sp. RAO-2017]|nr:hypothetical protein CDD83_9754 [Cordyceps sp. RAO-2017]